MSMAPAAPHGKPRCCPAARRLGGGLLAANALARLTNPASPRDRCPGPRARSARGRPGPAGPRGMPATRARGRARPKGPAALAGAGGAVLPCGTHTHTHTYTQRRCEASLS